MLKGFKTVIFNGIMMIIMWVKVKQPDIEVPGEAEIMQGIDYIDMALTFIWGIGNIVIRRFTNTAIFKKE